MWNGNLKDLKTGWAGDGESVHGEEMGLFRFQQYIAISIKLPGDKLKDTSNLCVESIFL